MDLQGKIATPVWTWRRGPLFSEKTQLQQQAYATQYVAGAVSDRNPTVVAVFE